MLQLKIKAHRMKFPSAGINHRLLLRVMNLLKVNKMKVSKMWIVLPSYTHLQHVSGIKNDRHIEDSSQLSKTYHIIINKIDCSTSRSMSLQWTPLRKTEEKYCAKKSLSNLMYNIILSNSKLHWLSTCYKKL